jgi:hypothetical protein
MKSINECNKCGHERSVKVVDYSFISLFMCVCGNESLQVSVFILTPYLDFHDITATIGNA